ncbi:threonine synthase [Miniphocaeibacter massiliensis]|uniref:threonine synthase n=1 Tax=Miniphocaeibacter massiliensis TaxID=2041841 RepID=UPI000C1BA3BB|nr:threonine synthase [Miniphocaeibacter massiliensis]
MKFKSTRDSSVSINAKEALLKGISDEGGLFVPEEIPRAGNVENMMEMKYRDLAYYICGKFMTDFEPEELSNCINSAYNDDNFSNPYIAPIRKVSDRYFLELFHGRTSAFKDMALSILPFFIDTSLKTSENYKEILIITATSGDTGKAALEGFHDVENIKIAVFYPEDGVSAIQKLQMQTQVGENVFVLGVKGNFDDCQKAVKDIFANKGFNEAINDKKIQLSSANSINIGRLIPQIVYYFSAYVNMLRYGELKNGEKINIVVPTGNFGNILAAYYAKEMGLPVNKLICASNENNVLTDFINTGIYDKNRELVLTSSPSMDILVSSNLERFIYHMSGNDSSVVASLMDDLNTKGIYNATETIKDNMNFIDAYYATEKEVKNKILNTLLSEKYLIDTHTAVASVVYDKYLKKTNDRTKTVIASTASPYKFASDILDALELNHDDLDDFEVMEKLSSLTNTEIPVNLSSLKGKEIRFDKYSKKEDILNNLEKFLGVNSNA